MPTMGAGGPACSSRGKMHRIVVSLLKGGVVKSETAVSLAHGMARQGLRVLPVDTDVRAQYNDMLGVDPRRGLADVIAGWTSPAEALCLREYSILYRYRRMSQVAAELEAVRAKGGFPKLLATLAGLDLLILGDWELERLDKR